MDGRTRWVAEWLLFYQIRARWKRKEMDEEKRREGRGESEIRTHPAKHARDVFQRFTLSVSLSLCVLSRARSLLCSFFLSPGGSAWGRSFFWRKMGVIYISVTYRLNNISSSKSGPRRDIFPVSQQRRNFLSSTRLSFPFACLPSSFPFPSVHRAVAEKGVVNTDGADKVSRARSTLPIPCPVVFPSLSLFSSPPLEGATGLAGTPGNSKAREGRKRLAAKSFDARSRAQDYQSRTIPASPAGSGG